jgi:hypothetical protein
VLSFLKWHYNNDYEGKNNSKEDKQLPFRSDHHVLSQTSNALPAIILVIMLIKEESNQRQSLTMPDNLKLPAENFAVICQPPLAFLAFTFITHFLKKCLSFYPFLYKKGENISLGF